MSEYKLDNLLDWGRVLEELDHLRNLRLLNEHQDGLKRILRYKRNWRLRECALQCAKEVTLPLDGLIQEVCSIMCDEDSYPELRIMAAEVITELFRVRNKNAESLPPFRGTPMHEQMKELLGTFLHPTLRQNVIRLLNDITGTEVEPDAR